jgi:hypothetical protein
MLDLAHRSGATPVSEYLEGGPVEAACGFGLPEFVGSPADAIERCLGLTAVREQRGDGFVMTHNHDTFSCEATILFMPSHRKSIPQKTRTMQRSIFGQDPQT